MVNGNWIKIYRHFLKWEWFDDPVMVKFFIYCLLKANFIDKRWQGQVIPRGSFITSRATLSRDLKLSEQQVRTCISRLKSTSEITSKTTNRFTLLTIVKYDDYQDYNEETASESTSQLTNKQPTNNQQTTTTKEYKESNIDVDNAREVSDGYKHQIAETEWQLWRENFYMKFRVQPGSMVKIMDEFINHLCVKQTVHDTLKDFQSHFYNWTLGKQSRGQLDKYIPGKRQKGDI